MSKRKETIEKSWNSCENEWCDGTMEDIRITCGAEAGVEEECNKCGRRTESMSGFVGHRVLFEGRKKEEYY